MHPVLFEVGGFPVHAYGASLALAFAVGISLAMSRARRRGFDPELVLEVSMVVLVSSIVGSRLLYVALNLDEFRPPQGSLRDVAWPSSRDGGTGLYGLSVMGGLPVAALSAWAMLRFRKEAVLPTLDLMAPSVALGAAITRIGCFLNGCCVGRVCPPATFGVAYPPGSPAARALGDVAVHAAPLYQSAAALVIFSLLLWLERRRPFPGAVFFALLAAMGVQRFAVEFVRFSAPNELLFGVGSIALSSYQAVALALVLVGAAGAWACRRSAGAPDGRASERAVRGG